MKMEGYHVEKRRGHELIWGVRRKDLERGGEASGVGSLGEE